MKLSKLLFRLLTLAGVFGNHIVDPNSGGGASPNGTPDAGGDGGASSGSQDGQGDAGAGDGDEGDDDGQQQGDAGAASKPNGDAANAGDKTVSKMQRKLDRRSRAIGQRDQLIAQQAAELERLRRGGQPQPTNDDDGEDQRNTNTRRAPANVDPVALARQIAEDTLYRQGIANKTSAMLAKGKEVNPKFQELVLEVAEEIPFVEGPQGQERPSRFIEDVLDCEHPHEILLHLQANSDELADLADMSPRQRARKLIELDLTFKKPASRRSNAPKPLELLQGGKGGGVRNEDQLSDAEWREQRMKQRGSK